jgi:HEAT repeat protein
VRRVAEDLLSGRIAPQDAAPILKASLAQPASSNWKEQTVAIWALCQVPLTETERKETLGFLELLLSQRPGRSIGCVLGSTFMCAHIGWVWLLYASGKDSSVNRVREAAATALGLMGGIHSLEELGRALVESPGAVASGDKSVRVAAAAALTRILSRNPEAGFGLLPSETTRSLCRLLRDPKESVVWWAIKALALVGNSGAIPYVNRTVKSHKSPAVRQEAASTLQVLNDRQRREQEHSTLLRATQPDQPNDFLLRPAADTGESAAEVLLRPTIDGETDA